MNLLKNISYAQNKEDIILATLLKDTKEGFYIDVGANDPETDSVTKWFYDRGWRGINVEPIPDNHAKFEADRPRDINLNIAIGSKRSKAVLREYDQASGHSTLSPHIKNDHDSQYSYKDYEVNVQTLKTVIREHVPEETSIDFLKIDVEGFEYEVIVANDWERLRPKVVCVEANHVKKDWRTILLAANYSLVFEDGLNEYYIDPNYFSGFDKNDFIERLIVNVQNSLSNNAYQFVQRKLSDEKNLRKLYQSQAEANSSRLEYLERTSLLNKPLRKRVSLALNAITIDWIRTKRR